jgi:DNA polymerase V
MQDIGQYDGDLLIIDRSLQPQHSNVIIAELYDKLTVKHLLITPEGPVLQPMNPAYPVIIHDPDTLETIGVVVQFKAITSITFCSLEGMITNIMYCR